MSIRAHAQQERACTTDLQLGLCVPARSGRIHVHHAICRQETALQLWPRGLAVTIARRDRCCERIRCMDVRKLGTCRVFCGFRDVLHDQNSQP